MKTLSTSVKIAVIRRLRPLPDLSVKEARAVSKLGKPILVKRDRAGRLVLVDGYRRLAASITLGKDSISAIIEEA